jgi:N-acyl-D-amino-acid deacylase
MKSAVMKKTPPPCPLPEAERGRRSSPPSPLRGGGGGEGLRSTLSVLPVLLCCLAVTAVPSWAADLSVTGTAPPALSSFDRMMTSFLRERGLPGAALAVGRKGKVVYARGFGWADRKARQPVQPDALFRIASVSKPITAVAVLQLVECGKLKLDDSVFGRLGLKAPKKGFDQRWKLVSVRHLLTHRGGWDSERSGDPMFQSPTIVRELGIAPPALPPAIIQWMLGRPLDFDPGRKEAYSNFGYCLLGRLVEKASGQTYENYDQQHVLAPLGIKNMRIGRTLSAVPGEVKYYESGKGIAIMGPSLGKSVSWPYGTWCVEAMDAHGGWIASAPDLVRFAMAFDDPMNCKILRAKTIEQMFAPPNPAEAKKDAWYAMGWNVRPRQCAGKPNIWHGGSLDGTSTLLVRRCDGLSWAVLFNTRRERRKKEPADAIDPLMHGAADAVKRWP